MFQKILIANRGEIAIRILRTAQRLGVYCIVVYSSADKNSLAVKRADAAVEIGPANARESYLNAEKILQIAIDFGAEAIHPGYGFLSENADFAEKCAANNIIFIGPPAASIRAMGVKNTAKILAEKHGIPTVPGYHGADQTLPTLTAAANKIGYPVLIKAAAGGGGKGMRIVNAEHELEQHIQGAQREALASFGDKTLLLEKYLVSARHVEIQVFADHFGHVVHLFERDCSLQRRYQKVIEEARAPDLSSDLRDRLAAAALTLTRAIHYVGAGTIECIVAENTFYFMEMNTRLQVEHPVTEMITGIDLVEWQLRIAANEPLPLTQSEIKAHGHAIEARLCAEDPDNQFLPMVGKLQHCHFPRENASLRVDSGISAGDEISPYYDSMIAKIITHGDTREQARNRLIQALQACQIVGVKTNRTLLLRLLAHPEFKAEHVATKFIAEHHDDLFKNTFSPIPILMATLSKLLNLSQTQQQNSDDHYSPWDRAEAKLTSAYPPQYFTWQCGDILHKVGFKLLSGADTESNYTFYYQDQIYTVSGHIEATTLFIKIDNAAYHAQIIHQDNEYHVFSADQHVCFSEKNAERIENNQDHQRHGRAPMHGSVIAIHVKTQQNIKRGDPLLTLEAMKMEHTLTAAFDGTVSQIFCQVGEQVSDGAELFTLEPAHDN